MPKISVLMPIYKTKTDYLKEAIQSVLDQTFFDFEFLILDDCPEDNREDIVKSFQDKRIKYFMNSKNLGITPSRNKLIALANGVYLAVMDHDDIAMPKRFEEQVKVLDKETQIGVVGCWVERFPKIKIAKYPEHNKEIEEYLMQGCAIPHTGAMIRKSVLKNMQYEEEFSPSEDYRLWCQLIGQTTFYNVPKVLMRYRWYEGNTSKKQLTLMTHATEKIRLFVRDKHKEIWKRVCQNSLHTVRVKLFGIIPLFTFKKRGNKVPSWIPFIKFKTKLLLK